MEVVESSDESDSDSDEKGDVSEIFCSICRILSAIACDFSMQRSMLNSPVCNLHFRK